MELLSRDEFREGVFARDGGKCVFCLAPAQDAHHIIERRLWPDGGYYLDNGASVCGDCHFKCEQTLYSVEDVRGAAKIKKAPLPPHLYSDQIYDKWGNPILENGRRLKGELFYDESVQKVLAPVLDQFTSYVKYPRTYHLPWSESIGKDDRVIESLAPFQQVVVTEKMDGENTTLYKGYIHARSIDGRSHPSRDWVKQFWSQIKQDIPEGWRLCGENLYAKHSIYYEDLPTYFMGFSIWNEQNTCLSWQDTLEWFELLGVTPVPTFYEGPFNEEHIRGIWRKEWSTLSEGYVIRDAGAIPYKEFKTKVGKFVRKNHIQTVKHWMYGQAVEPNGLRRD